ncbi:MAG: PaaI family thioesterase [Nitriliruptorales bacterium]|nr:PaaI family thioesterase [Nitriliruptorales bacterium]
MTERQRTYSWEDPTELAAAGIEMAGLDYLRAMQTGELPHPPICATIGFRFVEFEEGRAVMELETGEHQYNPIGTIHGSVIMALLDSVAGSAVHTTLPAGVGYTTVSINTSFLRAARADTGTLRAEGRLVKAGRRIALAEAELTDEDGKLYGHATASCMILGR